MQMPLCFGTASLMKCFVLIGFTQLLSRKLSMIAIPTETTPPGSSRRGRRPRLPGYRVRIRPSLVITVPATDSPNPGYHVGCIPPGRPGRLSPTDWTYCVPLTGASS